MDWMWHVFINVYGSVAPYRQKKEEEINFSNAYDVIKDLNMKKKTTK